MVKKILGFSLLAILTFGIFVVSSAPASLIWRYAEAPISKRVPELQITGIKGTVWSGQATAYYRQFPSSLASWEISPAATIASLFTGLKLSPNFKLEGEGHDLIGHVEATRDSVNVESLTGFIDALYINRVSQPQGLTFSGQVEVMELSFSSDSNWISQASGKIYWPGGQVISRTLLAGTNIFDLPPLAGDITMQGENIQLTIRPNTRNDVLLDIVIRPDGWVVVAVKEGIFEIAGVLQPFDSAADGTVLQFEEQLLKGSN